MGLLWRLFAPKPLKKARRTARKAAHPVRTATRAVTPKPVKQLQRAAHPVSSAELKIEDAAVNALRGRPRHQQSRHTAQASTDASPPSKRNPDEQGKPETARRDERPAWRRDGAETALFDGSDDLEVVGESYYLSRRICGAWWVRAGLMTGYATPSVPCWLPRRTIPTTRTRWRSGCRD